MQKYLIQKKQELKEKGITYLRIKVLPKTNQTKIRSILEDKTIKIDIKAPPTEGKANQELENFLKKEFNANRVTIISGKTNKIKLVKLQK